MPAVRFHDQDLPAFQEFDYGGARHADQGTTGAVAAHIKGAFDFARIDQVDYVLSIDMQDARQKMNGKAFASRQVLMHGLHGLTL